MHRISPSSIPNDINESKTVYEHPMLGQHVIIRTYSSGVHLGILMSIDYNCGVTEVILKDSRRLWKWSGAFTLSEVATKGVGDETRISANIPLHCVQNVIEIIPTTSEARSTYVKYYE